MKKPMCFANQNNVSFQQLLLVRNFTPLSHFAPSPVLMLDLMMRFRANTPVRLSVSSHAAFAMFFTGSGEQITSVSPSLSHPSPTSHPPARRKRITSPPKSVRRIFAPSDCIMRDDNQTKSKELLAQRALLFAPKMEADVGYGVLTRLLERLGGGSVPSRRTPPPLNPHYANGHQRASARETCRSPVAQPSQVAPLNEKNSRLD